MNARLDGISSIDLPNGPPQLPEDPSDCWVIVQADIGENGQSGADTFTFYITTPKHLAQAPVPTRRSVVVLERFDWGEVENHIRGRCAEAKGATWPELARSIGGEWEFDGYTVVGGDV